MVRRTAGYSMVKSFNTKVRQEGRKTIREAMRPEPPMETGTDDQEWQAYLAEQAWLEDEYDDYQECSCSYCQERRNRVVHYLV
jgi:O-methyltransferase involved in polyketide biosynthesis